ncbi:MAG: hypothetical protein IJU50_07755, partial [Lachnospiraceae bacterium]|nr:hypothetical protein [Lachnospiraceae bacterium]
VMETAEKEADLEMKALLRENNLYVYVRNGTMTMDNAALNAGITTDQFRSEMASHGYNVPQAV